MRAGLLVAAFLIAAGCSKDSTPRPQTRPAEPAYNRLIFAGDVMLSRGVRRQMLQAHDPALPFRKIAPLLAASDIAFVNLESPFSNRGPYHEGGLIFHASPDAIAGLKLAHIAIASTANNHSRDCGPHGVEYTVNWLLKNGIEPVGTSESPERTHAGVILERHGVRFGFLAYTFDQKNGNWRDLDERIAMADPDVLCRDVANMRRRADVVIVSMHHGIEYMPKPSKAQIAFAHAAVDAGASLVVGHHPHVTQPEEEYHGALIFYSLGNFIFDQYQREATQHGEIAQVSFLGRKILAAHLMRVKITPSGPELETP